MKRYGCFILILLAALCIPAKAEASGKTRSEAVNWATSQIGKGLDYDGVYGNQCVDLIKYYYAYFGVADYAMGNANAYITNSLPPGWIRVYSGYQPGDIAVWKVNHSCGTCSTGEYGHVGIITSADSAGFNAVNQNFAENPTCTQNWFNISSLQCAIRPAFSTTAPSANVSFADFNQNGIWETNAEMYIKIMNPDRATVSKVGCYLYNASGTLLKSYSENVNYTTAYVNYNCNINSDMKYTLSKGTTYKFVLYAVVNGKEYKDITRTFTTKGTAVSVSAPSITDIQVSEFDGRGYTVRCKVSDMSGIIKVQFPTWTEANGQDDIMDAWATNTAASGILGADGYYSYFVSVADHNFESGLYHTHIYAYSSSGENSSVKAMDVNIPKYCFKALDTQIGEDAVSSKDVCIVEGRIPLPKETSFSNISIVTSAEVNGRTISVTKDYGEKTIPGGSACIFEQLVDQKDFDNAQGSYTTVWNFEEADGTVTRQVITYNMSENPDTIYTKANTGDLCNLYDISGLSANEWMCETNTYYQNNIYDYITKPSDQGETTCLTQGRVYIIWKSRRTEERKIQVLDIQEKNAITNPAPTVEPDNKLPASSQTNDNTVVYRRDDGGNNKFSMKKVTKVKYKKKRKMVRLTWKKVSKASGYQIQIAKNKAFSKKRKKSDVPITSSLIFVKTKGKYYVRVRAYGYQNGKKVYGKWSAVKKVKV